MSKIFEDNSLTIGHTPLVRLNRIGNGRILAKVESRNPSFSVKCRIGANILDCAFHAFSTFRQHQVCT